LIKKKNPSSKIIGKSKKDNYHHENLKQDFIKEALRFLKTGSAEELSLRELSRRLGVSHMAPYRHFATKEDLLAEIIEDGFNNLSSRFEKVPIETGPAYETSFREHGKAYIQFVLDNHDQARLMFSGLLCDPKKHMAAHLAGQKAFQRLIDLIQGGQRSGYIRESDNAFMLGFMIWSTVHGSAMLMLENQFGMIENAPSFELDPYVHFMSEKMLKGLR
jgi:AcrR family transcriptional regulator